MGEGKKYNISSRLMQKLIFQLGTSYLLDDEIVTGKKHLREFLSFKPEGKLFAFGLNNLSTACWWDLHPNYHYYNPQDLYEDEVEDMGEFSE